MKAEMYDEGDEVILVKISGVRLKPASIIVDLINRDVCKKEINFKEIQLSGEQLMELLSDKINS